MIYAIYDTSTNVVVGSSTSLPLAVKGYAAVQVPAVPTAGSRIVNGQVVAPVAPAPTTADIEAFRAQQLALVVTRRDAYLALGVSTPVGIVQADVVSRANITEALNVSLASPTSFAITWRMADNSMVKLDAVKMSAVAQAVHAAVSTTYAKSFAIKTAINAATTLTKLRAILIDFSV